MIRINHAQSLILAVISGNIKNWRNNFEIYPIKTFSYGHIQHEKKLPNGKNFLQVSFFVALIILPLFASRKSLVKSLTKINQSFLLNIAIGRRQITGERQTTHSIKKLFPNGLLSSCVRQSKNLIAKGR